jgi:acid phosphatase type 7
LFEMTSTTHAPLPRIALLAGILGLAGTLHATEPLTLYLTWQQDPTTTMTILWHTEGEMGAKAVEWTGPSVAEPVRAEGASRPMPFSNRQIWQTELTGLEPDATYRFRLVDPETGEGSREYRFRTMPATDERPIRVIIGGDVRHNRRWMEETNRTAMRFNPDLIVWGGDLAYADGREDYLDRWIEFFDAMMTLIDKDGRVAPVLAGIGNHEVRGGYYWGENRGRDSYRDTNEFRERIAPYYYSLFPFPGHPGYAALDFGNYLSLIFLDTDHTTPVEGKQTDWLESALQQRAHFKHIIPVYHVPAYPSVREFNGSTNQRVRQHWLPLFESHGVRIAFENHDHAYKRTIPLRGGESHPDGIVFLGDGAWGVGTRDIHPVEQTWYLAVAEPVRHFVLATLHDRSIDLKAVSQDGHLIDHAFVAPQPPSARAN